MNQLFHTHLLHKYVQIMVLYQAVFEHSHFLTTATNKNKFHIEELRE
jgi:hypothetical protein